MAGMQIRTGEAEEKSPAKTVILDVTPSFPSIPTSSLRQSIICLSFIFPRVFLSEMIPESNEIRCVEGKVLSLHPDTADLYFPPVV
jgi:hypothetical protein